MITRSTSVRRSRWRLRGAYSLVLALTAGAVLAAAADTPLIEAARKGDTAAVRSLLRNGAAAGATAADGTTALHWAVRRDDRTTAQALLAAGAPVSAADRYGVTPLALAAVNGSAPAVEMLLNAGANPNAASGEGETVLMAAARTGRPEPIRLLLAKGADPNAFERGYGETALMWAAGHNHPDAVRVLARGGANLDAKSTVIDLPPAKVDLATMVTTALPRGGMTALMFAARQGSVEATRALIEVKADLNAVDPEGVSAIVLAIINAHFDVAAVLADAGADLSVADNAGMAALYAAADMAYPPNLLNRPRMRPTGPPASELVKLLLERGADPNQTLKSPTLMRQHSTGDASLGNGATPLMRAAKVPDLTLMRMLLAKGANPSAALPNQTTVLMQVAAAPSARTLAPETTAYQAVALLLEHGANVNATNANGETLLHQHVGKSEAFVRLLTSRGARVDLQDKSGRTPLDIAMGVPPVVTADAGGGRGGRGGARAGGPGGPGGRGGPGGAPVRASDATVALLKELMNAK